MLSIINPSELYISTQEKYLPINDATSALYLSNIILFGVIFSFFILNPFKKNLENKEKTKIKIVWIALLSGTILGTAAYFYIKILGALIGNIILTSLLLYAIIAHDLMNIKRFAKKALIYFPSIFTIIALQALLRITSQSMFSY